MNAHRNKSKTGRELPAYWEKKRGEIMIKLVKHDSLPSKPVMADDEDEEKNRPRVRKT